MEIFHFYKGEPEYTYRWWWKKLTNVCRRWRDIIFASPRHLDVQLECTHRTPTRTSLDVWPPFPIAIYCEPKELDDEGQDNIIAALEHHDRVILIALNCQKLFLLEKFSAVTQKPFPVLTDLFLTSSDEMAPVLHEEFLGGSVPDLREISLRNIVFLAFPKLALSATHLSFLSLWDIPITGYISPEALANCVSGLPNLEILSIGFESPRSRPDRIALPPPTRAILPTLAIFEFKGVSEYLEDLVARIDTPKLHRLEIRLFMDLMFRIPQLHKFIARKKWQFDRAAITFFSFAIKISLTPPDRAVELMIRCKEPDWQAESMAQVCSQLSPLLSHVEQLDIRENSPRDTLRGNGIDPTQLLELFHPFLAVQDLRIYDDLRPLVARALQDLTGERAAEVLPTLGTIFFYGWSLSVSIQEDMQPFIVARQHSDHPVEAKWIVGYPSVRHDQLLLLLPTNSLQIQPTSAD